MMSTSPLFGQRPSMPNDQNAGQSPARVSMRARISNLPYFQLALPRVLMLADVYSANSRLFFQFALPASKFGFFFCSRRPSMISMPFSHHAFSG